MNNKSKYIALLFLIGFLTTSCYTVHHVVPQTYNYSKSIEFKIDKIEEGTRIATGNGHYYTKRGEKFVFIFLTLKNNLEQKQKLDFDNFLLLNPKTRTKHKVEWAMVPGVINIWGKVDSQIGKGDEKKRKLVFIYPSEEKAGLLMVNDTIIDIEYAK